MCSFKSGFFWVLSTTYYLAALAPAPLQAVSASPDPVAVVLPDKSIIMIRGVGDEWRHYAETVDGYTVLRDTDGWYRYALRDDRGELQPSDRRAQSVARRTADEELFLQGIGKHIRFTAIDKRPARTGAVREQASIQTLRDLTSRQDAAGATVNNILLILIDYSDLTASETVASFDNMMNQPGFDGGFGSTGSFNDYYEEVSYGQFGVVADVYGWYRAAQGYVYYGENSGPYRAPELVREAVDAAEAAGVDFSRYDNDGDGTAEGICVVHAGPGAEEGSQTQYIWSHRWALSVIGAAVLYDGVWINGYTIQPEKQYSRHAGIGVYAHEYGHDLGLPDLYDTDGTSEGIGHWGIMGSGSWLNNGRTPSHLTPWCKAQAGWIQPTVISLNGTYQYQPASQSAGSFHRIQHPASPAEYFLIENRQKLGFDSYLPGDGLLIWHIDSSVIALTTPSNTVNDDENHKGIDLEAADGTRDMDFNTNRGDSGDPFPGSSNNSTFDDNSNPSARDYAGSLSDIVITDISSSSTTMSASITVPGGEVPQPVHFTPVYTGNPYLAMNIYVSSAQLDGVDLEAGDEIGIFDGEVCVGAGVLTGPVTTILPLVAATDDPTTTAVDGFTPGALISYRLWDSSDPVETPYVTPTYSSGTGTFVSQGTAVVGLEGSTQAPEPQHFQVAYTGNPYLAMNIYVSSAQLDGVDLEAGDEIGIFDGEVCVGAGLLSGPITSYLSLVASTDDPTTTAVDGFTPGALISYRLWDSSDLAEAPYVTPTYSSGTGTFVSQGTAVVGLDGSTQAPEPQHFQVAYTGNPYLAMNIYVSSAQLDGVDLEAGDEIGIFDGEVCVGAGLLSGPITSYLSLVAATDDPTTPTVDGFTPGALISYRLWDSSDLAEAPYVTPTYSSGTGTFASQGTAVVGLEGFTNVPPVWSLPDTLYFAEDESLAIDLDTLVSDDLDPADALVLTVVTAGEVLSSLDNTTHLLTLTAPLNFNGTDTAYFSATDQAGLTSYDTAIVTVLPVNDPPVVAGIPDQTIQEGATFAAISLDGYVSDVDNADSDITWTSSGNSGLTVSIDGNRVATIGVPNADWYGSETITFTATDPGGLSDYDPATFTVTAVNDTPAVADIPDQTIDEGGAFATIALDDYISDVDNIDSEITWTFGGNSELTVSIDGARIATIAIPGTEWSGSEAITFTATDPGGLSDSDPATFTVTAVNDTPAVADIPDQTIDEGDSFVTISLDEYVSDQDNIDSEITWTYGGNSELTVSIDGAHIATIGIPDAEWSGSEAITFTATDPGGLSDSDPATFTVTAVNDTPVVADIPDQTIEEGGAFVTIALDDYVSDPDNVDSEIIWTVRWDRSLIVTIDTNRIATISIRLADWYGSETITFTAKDPGGLTDSDPTTFTVMAVNDTPVVADIPDQTIEEGGAFATIALDEYVSDVDNADSDITWTYGGNSALTVTIDGGRIATIGIQAAEWSGSEAITFTATDPGGLSDSNSATFTVTAVNDTPAVVNIPDQTIEEGGAFATIALDEYVNDLDNADSEITWTFGGNSELIISIDTGRIATVLTPDADWSGSEAITFTATDPGGLSDSDPATFTVTAVNDTPVVADIPDQTIEEGGAFATIALDDYVSDLDNADSEITWTFGGNSELTVSIDTARIATVAIPDADWSGSETITFTATDPDIASDSNPATFTVTAINDPPVFVSALPDTGFAEDALLTIPWATWFDFVEDPDHPDTVLVWNFFENDSIGFVVDSSGVTFTAALNWFGVDTILVEVSDGLLSDTTVLILTVSPVNDAPSDFALVEPGNDSTIFITKETINDTLYLVWEQTSDVDGDSVWYGLEIFGDLTVLMGEDTTLADNSLSYMLQAFVDRARSLGDSIFSGEWMAFATDGKDTTWAQGDPFALTIKISDHLLALLATETLPEEFALHQNYPNPFNPTTTIEFDLPVSTNIRIVVFNLMGQEVARLLDQRLEAGYHQLVWNGRDVRGHTVPTGMYIVVMRGAPGYTKSIKVLLLK